MDQTVDGREAERTCDVCGKVVKGGGGLYAHLLLAHNVRRPSKAKWYEQESKRLLAEIGWKETEIGNLKSQVASLQQESQKWKRLSFEGNCKACGRDLWYSHKIEAIPTKAGKLVGTAFICE
jgi:hypothetical protein